MAQAVSPIALHSENPRSATVAVTLANPGQGYVIYGADNREKEEPGQGTPAAAGGLFSCRPARIGCAFWIRPRGK